MPCFFNQSKPGIYPQKKTALPKVVPAPLHTDCFVIPGNKIQPRAIAQQCPVGEWIGSSIIRVVRPADICIERQIDAERHFFVCFYRCLLGA